MSESATPNEPTISIDAHVQNAVAELLAQEPIGRFFTYTHLPEHLRCVSQPFAELAARLIGTLERSAERTVALRKLLESKDAAVRARL